MDSCFGLIRPRQHVIANKRLMGSSPLIKRLKVKQNGIIVGCGYDSKVNYDDSGKLEPQNSLTLADFNCICPSL